MAAQVDGFWNVQNPFVHATRPCAASLRNLLLLADIGDTDNVFTLPFWVILMLLVVVSATQLHTRPFTCALSSITDGRIDRLIATLPVCRRAGRHGPLYLVVIIQT